MLYFPWFLDFAILNENRKTGRTDFILGTRMTDVPVWYAALAHFIYDDSYKVKFIQLIDCYELYEKLDREYVYNYKDK